MDGLSPDDEAFWQKIEPLLVEAYADQSLSDATIKAIEALCPPIPVSQELMERLESEFAELVKNDEQK